MKVKTKKEKLAVFYAEKLDTPKTVKKKLSFSEKLLVESIEAMCKASCDFTATLVRERAFLREYQKHITTKEVNEQ